MSEVSYSPGAPTQCEDCAEHYDVVVMTQNGQDWDYFRGHACTRRYASLLLGMADEAERLQRATDNERNNLAALERLLEYRETGQ